MKQRNPQKDRYVLPEPTAETSPEMAAMYRAARQARRRASAYGGAIAVYEDGKVVWKKVEGENVVEG